MEFLQNVKFTSETWRLILPFIMMGLDIVTGLIYAWSSKSFQSTKMRSGLAKKAGEAVIIVIGELCLWALHFPDAIMTGISVYIIFMEFMSIIENLDKLGVPLPDRIKKVINNHSEEDLKELIETIADMEEKENGKNSK